MVQEDSKHMLANDASVKDMEGAAVAWACEQHNTPYFCIKVFQNISSLNRLCTDKRPWQLHAVQKLR
jgi:nucleoside phosphorylase